MPQQPFNDDESDQLEASHKDDGFNIASLSQDEQTFRP